MDERYPEVAARRRILQALYGKVVSAPMLPVYFELEELTRVGGEAGFDQTQSIRLLKALTAEGYIRGPGGGYVVKSTNYPPFISRIWLEDLTDKGKRLIGVLPAVDSVEGVVASLEELAEQIRESQILSPEEKDQQVRALRTLMGDLRQAGVGIGAQVLLQYLARGLGG